MPTRLPSSRTMVRSNSNGQDNLIQYFDGEIVGMRSAQHFNYDQRKWLYT